MLILVRRWTGGGLNGVDLDKALTCAGWRLNWQAVHRWHIVVRVRLPFRCDQV